MNGGLFRALTRSMTNASLVRETPRSPHPLQSSAVPELLAGLTGMSRRRSSGADRARFVALFLLLGAPACTAIVDSGSGEICTPPPNDALGTSTIVCDACAAGCQAITSQVSVCVAPAPIATMCSTDVDVPAADNDCACEGRTCDAGQVCYNQLIAWDNSTRHNRCGPPAECVTNSDCATGKVCIPPFSSGQGLVEFSDANHSGNPGGVCVIPECQTDADCTAAPCGVCALRVRRLSINSGLGTLDGVKCVYGTAAE